MMIRPQLCIISCFVFRRMSQVKEMRKEKEGEEGRRKREEKNVGVVKVSQRTKEQYAQA